MVAVVVHCTCSTCSSSSSIRGGGGERVCGSADLTKNFHRIADFNNNFSRSVDLINLMDSDFGKNRALADCRFN